MANLTTEEISGYCNKFQLDPQNTPPYNSKTRYYYVEKEKLSLKRDLQGNQAYSDEQINKLIFRKFSKNIVESVINLHAQLIKYFSPDVIVSVAAHSGGSKNLEAVWPQNSTCSRALFSKWRTFQITKNASKLYFFDGLGVFNGRYFKICSSS